ncbi:MAG: SagB/ThcOx family dehydrogenase [Deltaproteobacteria bacterium]|nr:SagB/ThcOx family dehydrogenase [Deltaproteobacteria bacterium]
MNPNHELAATWTYHNSTKHSLESIRRNRHFLDWDNKPLPFKIYSSLDPLQLPINVPPLETPTLSAIRGTTKSESEQIPDLATLTSLLYLSAGITKRRTYPGGEVYFRAAANTGALYHIDVYVVCGELPDLAAGVYHFGPHDFSLRCLRQGDYRRVLVQAGGDEQHVNQAPATLICISTYWRNAWKYQARTYRHCFWDAGTLLANFLAAAAALKTHTQVVTGFVDAAVNQLLDLDTDREVALALLPIGYAVSAHAGAVASVSPLNLATVPLSDHEVDYPAIRAMHAASSLQTDEEVRTWRDGVLQLSESSPTGKLFPLTPLGDAELPAAPLEQVIRHRGSTRRFAREPISFAQLSTLLVRSTQGIQADFLTPFGTTLTEIYLLVNAVEGIPSGAYVFHRSQHVLGLLREGSFRKEAGYLGLGQELPADASVNIYCLANLPSILERFGNRGYRAAQLEGAIIGGKCYLAAYAQQLGATGLTFFDDDVTEFFSPHATGKSVMFLTAIGKPAKQQR